jgi:PEGA domain
MKKGFVGLMLALLCGCAVPTTTVSTIDDRPALAFKGAPEGALVYVDGLNMGSANEYNGDPKILNVLPGSHTLRITANGATIYEQRVFVESSLKTITVK